jgi:hypothetical protein
VADISIFSYFPYDNKESLDDFLLVNVLAHQNYTAALELSGFPPLTYPILDVAWSEEGIEDWLQSHYLMHKALAATLNLSEVPDLSDLEIHDPDQFESWLQLHQQQHQLIDAALDL